MANTPAGEALEGATPFRRSTRTHRAPASYAEVEDEDEMEGLECDGPAGDSSLVLRAPQSPAGGTVSSSRYTLVETSSDSRRVRSRTLDSSISDPDYGPKRVQRKRRRLDGAGRLASGDISQMPRELEMRKICTRLKIDFALFDAWPEDPTEIDYTKLHIPYLPNEIMYQILENCRSEVLVNCQKSCARFRAILQDNPGIWLKARQKYYPGIPDELPFGLDEESLFELATGKNCDYCPKLVRAKAYYIWSVRACSDCLKSLTMCITDFRNLLKRKCKDEDEWTHSAREQVCAAIYWRGNPFAAKQCWKSRAYELIEEAEEHMLDGSFQEWILTQAVPGSAMIKVRQLESWGVGVVKRMEADKFGREEKSRQLRRVHFQKWCMLLPAPIPESVLRQSETYWATCRTSGHLTKYEFISKLPKLLKECNAVTQLERMKKHLAALWRVQQNSVFDRACTDIIIRIMKEGGVSARNWETIIHDALKEVGSADIKIRIPRDMPMSLYRRAWEFQPHLDGAQLMDWICLLEEKISDACDRSLLLPETFEFFGNGQDKIFRCPSSNVVSVLFSERELCPHKGLMSLRELAVHLFTVHRSERSYHKSIWLEPEKVIVSPPSARSIPRPSKANNGKRYWQKDLNQFYPWISRKPAVRRNKVNKKPAAKVVRMRSQDITKFFRASPLPAAPRAPQMG